MPRTEPRCSCPEARALREVLARIRGLAHGQLMMYGSPRAMDIMREVDAVLALEEFPG